MVFSLQKVTQDERQILWNLLQYMVFETSVYGKNEIQDDGTFSYKHFDKYFSDDDRIAFLIRDLDNRLLGFVMVNQYLQKVKSGHAIAEFMILPRFRRRGIGRVVARQCFELFPGNWEVQPAPGSEMAYQFWKNTIDELTGLDNQMSDGIFVFNYDPAIVGARTMSDNRYKSLKRAEGDTRKNGLSAGSREGNLACFKENLHV